MWVIQGTGRKDNKITLQCKFEKRHDETTPETADAMSAWWEGEVSHTSGFKN